MEGIIFGILRYINSFTPRPSYGEILSFASVNESLWCYHLNESPLVELLLSAIYFSLGISLKRSLDTLRVSLFHS